MINRAPDNREGSSAVKIEYVAREELDKNGGFFFEPAGHSALVMDLEDGEPIFVLRARDASALYIASLDRESAFALLDDERMQHLIDTIEAMVKWRRENRSLVRDAD